MQFDLTLNNRSALISSTQHFYFFSKGKLINFFGEKVFHEYRNFEGLKQDVNVFFLPDLKQFVWVVNDDYEICDNLRHALEAVQPCYSTISEIFKGLSNRNFPTEILY